MRKSKNMCLQFNFVIVVSFKVGLLKLRLGVGQLVVELLVVHCVYVVCFLLIFVDLYF